jgi:glycosyltransferase involved in cell wall biosynthesis
MHTDPRDPHGQDLVSLLQNLNLTDGQIMISSQKVAPTNLSMLYNMADCTINISDAEGFGLATFESLACGTPIIVNMTGGLQEQVTNGESWFGIGIEPSSKAVIGSQQVPFIYEDRISKEDFIDALEKMYSMSKSDRKAMGLAGREHVLQNYNMEVFAKQWDQIFTYAYENLGSWDTRKNYKSWEFMEL